MIPYATLFPIGTTPQVMKTYSNREPTDCFCSSYTCLSLSVPSATSGGYPLFHNRFICHYLRMKQFTPHRPWKHTPVQNPRTVSIPQVSVFICRLYWSWSRNKTVYSTQSLGTYSSREPTDCFRSPSTCLRCWSCFCSLSLPSHTKWSCYWYLPTVSLYSTPLQRPPNCCFPLRSPG